MRGHPNGGRTHLLWVGLTVMLIVLPALAMAFPFTPGSNLNSAYAEGVVDQANSVTSEVVTNQGTVVSTNMCRNTMVYYVYITFENHVTSINPGDGAMCFELVVFNNAIDARCMSVDDVNNPAAVATNTGSLPGTGSATNSAVMYFASTLPAPSTPDNLRETTEPVGGHHVGKAPDVRANYFDSQVAVDLNYIDNPATARGGPDMAAVLSDYKLVTGDLDAGENLDLNVTRGHDLPRLYTNCVATPLRI